jgi:glycosyltransferase involved in cell wall biosynthesis
LDQALFKYMLQKPSILLIHNTYLQKGGEDSIVAQEIECLEAEKYPVRVLYFNNSTKSLTSLFSYPFQLFFNLSAFIKVYRLVKKHGIQIVHVHNFYYKASPAVFWAAKLAGANTILTVHNYRLFCLNGLLYYHNQPCTICHQEQDFKAGIDRKCFKGSGFFSRALAWSNHFHKSIQTFSSKIDRFIVINPLQEQMLLEIGIEAAKIRYKPNFLSGFNHAAPPLFETRKSYYLYVGRLSEEKGVKDLVAAFKENGKQLQIVGDGPLADWVAQSTDENISYSKAMPRADLLAYYTNCAALILPSRWYEGQPMTVIEAQSMGTIVIAAYSDNMSHMILDGQNGFLYAIEPMYQLNQVISKFEQISLAEKEIISKAAYDQYIKNYSLEKHIKAIHQLYQFESGI